jgi:large conductance mechanosensitive channel
MLKEFRDFAMRGNVVDLAVGIVIGVAFGAIANSLVTDIILPVVGLATGGLDFSQRHVVLREGTPPSPYVTLAAAKDAGAVTLNIGMFLNLVVNFVIVAFALFVVVKAMNAVRRGREAAAPAPAPAREEVLLTEIRDILRERPVSR